MSEVVAGSSLVVVGASAGGVEALTTLVGGLRVPFPAPIVIAQHLDPTRPDHLGEIWRAARRCPSSLSRTMPYFRRARSMLSRRTAMCRSPTTI